MLFIDFSSNTQSFLLWAVRIGGRTDLSWWLVQKTWCWIKGTWICGIWKWFLTEYSDNWDRRETDILRKQRGQAWLLSYVEGSLGTKEILREDTEVVIRSGSWKRLSLSTELVQIVKFRCGWAGSQALGIEKAELRGLDILWAGSWDIQYGDRIKDKTQGEAMAENGVECLINSGDGEWTTNS